MALHAGILGFDGVGFADASLHTVGAVGVGREILVVRTAREYHGLRAVGD